MPESARLYQLLKGWLVLCSVLLIGLGVLDLFAVPTTQEVAVIVAALSSIPFYIILTSRSTKGCANLPYGVCLMIMLAYEIIILAEIGHLSWNYFYSSQNCIISIGLSTTMLVAFVYSAYVNRQLLDRLHEAPQDRYLN